MFVIADLFWCRDEALDQVDYALEISPKLLQFLEGYFNAEYPLPKLDMAAIPNFKFNGMENWGLIMYRESAVLYDPLVSTINSKRGLITVIAHEISHMWFGNLVTPKWWSELWLKEGFANFMGYMAIENVEPNWKMMDYSVRKSMYNALMADSLLSSHPINVEVNNPDRISEIFDSISYDKGASIIRMMYHFLSEEVYKRGMQNYVKILQYDNAVQGDLWRFLTQSWNESESFDPSRTVQTIMNTWTLQEGYPVVNITRNATHLHLSQ
ncbi:Aminopeptidase N, partial [Armadillidium vulgare]